MKGFEHPHIVTPPPGEKTKAWIERMKKVEAPNITYRDNEFPVFIKSAFMNNVWDVDGNRYVDLTSFFGVTLLGHRHPEIQKAIQSASIYHGMGDVHPTPHKVELLEKINKLIGGNYMGIFAQSGSEAVETCLKTQLLYTKKPGIIVFEGAYHGLGLGALNLTSRKFFKEGLEVYLSIPVYELPFPGDNNKSYHVLELAENLLKKQKIGLIFLEPIQGRGGVRIFPDFFLREIRFLAGKYNALLGFDEIFTGVFRTGFFSYAQSKGVAFDLITFGKGLSSQFPLSVCMGKKHIMEKAWPESNGEAKHTYTFLGHPLFSLVALKVIETVEKQQIDTKIQTKGKEYLKTLLQLKMHPSVLDVRGRGFMIGIEFKHNVFPLVKKLLQHGYITLPAGKDGRVLEIIPPSCIEDDLFFRFLEVLHGIIE